MAAVVGPIPYAAVVGEARRLGLDKEETADFLVMMAEMDRQYQNSRNTKRGS